MASREPGRGLGLHGHGVRERQLRGPTSPDAASTTVVLVCRRYRCTTCGTLLLVVPRGVAPRKHYGFAAIAMALALWLLIGEPVREVRRRVCAWPVTHARTSVWPALRRWRRAFGDAWAQVAMGRAPPDVATRERAALAFLGGAAMP